jgi:protein disulfide-isomerase A1
MKALLLLLCFAAVFAEYTLDEGVVVLTDSNFDQALSEFDYALVEFYAPWCGHCKNLAPHYAKAAQELAQTNPNVKLCKVDATVEKGLASKFEIRGFPTLQFFVKGSSTPIKYEGGRTTPEIINWLKKKTGPTSVEIKSTDEADKQIGDNEVVVFYFGPSDSEAYKNFISAAQSYDDLAFGHSHDTSVRQKHEADNVETIVIYKKFDEGKNVYTGPFNTEDIKNFINSKRFPTILPFDQKIASKIFGGGKDTLFLIRGNDEKGAQAESALKEIAHDIKDKIQLSVARIEDTMGGKLAEYIGVARDSLPAIRIVQPGQNMKKFLYELELTGTNIKQYVQDFYENKLKPYFKSQDIPANSHEDNVRVVVSKNFNDVVLNPEDDVLVEYYAPWCGHCKSLAPIYAGLAGKLKNVKNLVIAKMDATANEVEGVQVQGFPTIKFYPKGAVKKVVDYSGERTEQGFVDFLKKHSSANLNSVFQDEL